jgi:hypothetical protein
VSNSVRFFVGHGLPPLRVKKVILLMKGGINNNWRRSTESVPSKSNSVCLMKLMLLGPFIALLACCPGYAEFNNYFLSPSDADVSYWTAYKFPSGDIQGYVTSATLYVSPAALPVWNTTLGLYGYESTTPLLGGPTTSWYDIGTRYYRRNIRFGEYAELDVTDFMRNVKSPYVEIHISTDELFTRGAQLRVTTFVPEPSSFDYLAICIGALLIASRSRHPRFRVK